MSRFAAILVLCLTLSPAPAFAVQPDEILSDPKLEQRARNLSAGLRCLVCQNQSIDDSDAPLARDLRLLVRERLKAGDNDGQVIDYIVARYGEFVLLKPRFGTHTLLLWLGPLLLFLGGVFAVWRLFRRREAASVPAAEKPLSASEKKRLSQILDRG
ncbi:MAG: cytochrome c-type biogenesis protein CcmH [Hyphomicrobiales bacterium]